MYNYPKLGSFIELKRTRSIEITKSYARKVYEDAENVVLSEDNIYFVLPVVLFTDDSLYPEHEVARVVFKMPRDTSTKGTIYTAHTFHNDLLIHPDYNTKVVEIKGTLTGFIKDLDR